MSWTRNLATRILREALNDEVADLALERALKLQKETGKALHITAEIIEGPEKGAKVTLKVLNFTRR